MSWLAWIAWGDVLIAVGSVVAWELAVKKIVMTAWESVNAKLF